MGSLILRPLLFKRFLGGMNCGKKQDLPRKTIPNETNKYKLIRNFTAKEQNEILKINFPIFGHKIIHRFILSKDKNKLTIHLYRVNNVLNQINTDLKQRNEEGFEEGLNLLFINLTINGSLFYLILNKIQFNANLKINNELKQKYKRIDLTSIFLDVNNYGKTDKNLKDEDQIFIRKFWPEWIKEYQLAYDFSEIKNIQPNIKYELKNQSLQMYNNSGTTPTSHSTTISYNLPDKYGFFIKGAIIKDELQKLNSCVLGLIIQKRKNNLKNIGYIATIHDNRKDTDIPGNYENKFNHFNAWYVKNIPFPLNPSKCKDDEYKRIN